MSRSAVFAVLISFALFLFPALSPGVPEGVVLKWPGGSEGTVVFDGTTHSKKGLHCDACHIAGLFQTKKDADKMTMAALNEGRFCGTCHNGKKAFSTSDPKKCHECHRGEKKNHADGKHAEKRRRKHD